jgi:regulator of sirC expression with transglutaminase-like and TPR domain
VTLDPAIGEELAAIGRAADEDIDLARAGLALARATRPHAAPEPYLRHLDLLVEETRLYAGASPPVLPLRVEALRNVLARRFGYGGDDQVFTDVDAANLMHVIDSRRGLPVVLGLIVIHVSRMLGWAAAGLDFPGRFLVRLEDGQRRCIVDPLRGLPELVPADLRELLKTVLGREAELTPDLYRPMANRAILARMQNNIKLRHIRAGRLEEALTVIESLMLITPGQTTLWREAGLVHARLKQFGEAIATLEAYLARDGSQAARHHVAVLLERLRRSERGEA